MLSKSVATAFATIRELEGPDSSLADTSETEKFCLMFDRFFDMMNTRSVQEARRERMPDLLPYYSPSDKRLKVSGIVLHIRVALLWWC